MMRMFIVALLLLLSQHLFAEDAYHAALRQQLQDEFGITGGEWVLGETESQTNSKIQLSRVTRKTLDADESQPFSKILELVVASRGDNSWDNAARFPSSTEIKKGDALLVVAWFNSIEADEGLNHVTHKFELTHDPYTQSLILGADIKPGWRQWFLPFEADVDMTVGEGRYQLDMGHMAGTLQLAGVAVLNFGPAYTVDDLPVSTHHMDYEGREDGAAWRTEALQRIDSIRKGDLRVKVVNRNGDAIKHAQVTANMTRHEFGFGTAISSRWWYRNTPDADTYLSKLEDLTGDGRTFSIVVFENALKWPAWENSWQTTPEQNAEIVDWLRGIGIKIRGHNLVWPKWNHLPDDLQQHENDPDYIRNRIHDHIFEVAGYDGIKGYLAEWDVINEMVHCVDLANVFGTEDIYTDWFNWAHEADPNALLYLNEYSIINGGGNDLQSQEKYKEIIERLIDQGAPLDGLGVQGHMGANFTAPARVLEILDDFGQYNLPISITEYDASGATDEIAADYMRDILIASFSHPAMQNFLMWGFWDGAHFNGDAPIFSQDWTLKPSGETFIKWVFDTWWTNADGITTRDGLYSTRAFYGDYVITAEFDGQQVQQSFTFSSDDTSTLVLHIDSEETSVESSRALPQSVELSANYPNPFNPTTTIEYAVPHNMTVTLQVYDTNGRQVATLVQQPQKAGWHRAEFNNDNLASGIYYYRLQAGNIVKTRKMLLLR